MNSGIERRTTDTAFETGFLDAVENILTVEYFTHRTMREHDDYVVGYRYGRLSLERKTKQTCETPILDWRAFRIEGELQQNSVVKDLLTTADDKKAEAGGEKAA